MRLDSAISLVQELQDKWSGGSSAFAALASKKSSQAGRKAIRSIGVGSIGLDDNHFGIIVGTRTRIRSIRESILRDSLLAKLPRSEVKTVATGRIAAYPSSKRKAKQRKTGFEANHPIPPGHSFGHHSNGSGTLGCYVRNGQADWIGGLSNNHVLVCGNASSVADHSIAPGKSDKGMHPSHAFGILDPWVQILANGSNELDAAVAKVTRLTAIPANPRLIPGLGVLSGEVVNASDLQSLIANSVTVRKRGRTTNATEGRVAQVAANISVDYPFCSEVKFENVIAIRDTGGYRPFAKLGDSGSLVVIENGKLHESGMPMLDAVGLVFAVTTHNYSEKNPATTYAIPLEPILQKFNLKI